MSLSDIEELISDDSSILAFLQYNNLILTEKICEFCNIKCKLIKVKEKFYFRCCQSNCYRRYTSTPHNFWLSNCKLSYTNVILLIFFFINDCTVSQVTAFLEISPTTTVDWFSFCREVCIFDIILNSTKIGGEGKVVEVDESAFGKRKYNKGKFAKTTWVFGGIERGSNRCFLIPFEKRDSKTLCDLIEKNILPGTTIISDCWEGYNDIDKSLLTHLELNHSLNFIDSTTGADTNKIESTWAQVKFKIPSKGRTKAHLPGYFATFLFRKKYDKSELFQRFVDAIKYVDCS